MKKSIFLKSCVLPLASICLTSAVNAAVVLAEATSEPVEINNLTNKVASAGEILAMPSAWGDDSAPTLTIAGAVQQTEGDDYFLWDTEPMMPDEYLVTLTYGATTNTARFTVAAIAEADWSALDLDNLVQPRTAKDSETISLPASWGESSVTGLKLVWTDETGTHEQAIADASTKSIDWSTVPLMPGAYGVRLVYDGGAEQTAEYEVASLDGGIASVGAVSVDNQFDTDAAGTDVRDIGLHTNEFVMTWVGSTNATLTLDGEQMAEVEEAGWNWQWETNGLTYALYTFTNRVDGSNYVARFRVNSDWVAAHFHEDTNDVFVAKDWYQQHVQQLGVADSRKVISDALKEVPVDGNGYAYWKSYVLGVTPSTAFDLRSNIATTNIAPNQIEVTVWPLNKIEVTPGSQATVVYGIEYTDGLETPQWKQAKSLIGSGDVKFTETLTDHAKRFYRTNLDVEPTPKTQQ